MTPEGVAQGVEGGAGDLPQQRPWHGTAPGDAHRARSGVRHRRRAARVREGGRV